ncbi:MAG TPA: iron-sulfur cluster repair di-iron protein [Candidatus Didemnitutus sp.]|nr:iron-sulfur cluster repair di-iron protein [Candidatus Didemnitutus sp.]
MNSVTDFEITGETRIGDIVAARPALARVFEELRIDYCCGGKQTLAVASARRGLAPATVLGLLEAATEIRSATAVQDAAKLSLTELADHIERTHHAYLKAELPRLVELAERVARKHRERDARLAEVAGIVYELTTEMISHMQKEEQVLFPLVRQIEAGEFDDDADILLGPIACMESEHDQAGALTARLRQLTDDYTPDAEACNSHRALLAGLAEFETDLHQHVHKENNLLFPRALAAARLLRDR